GVQGEDVPGVLGDRARRGQDDGNVIGGGNGPPAENEHRESRDTQTEPAALVPPAFRQVRLAARQWTTRLRLPLRFVVDDVGAARDHGPTLLGIGSWEKVSKNAARSLRRSRG